MEAGQRRTDHSGAKLHPFRNSTGLNETSTHIFKPDKLSSFGYGSKDTWVTVLRINRDRNVDMKYAKDLFNDHIIS